MIKLHGTPLSNYYNMVKHALLEKGLAFEEVAVRPSQEPAFLARSPMGKVPVLETDEGFLTETDAILDYLDESHPQTPLFPAEPYARARVRQLMKTQELYVETPAHDLIMALFGRELPAHVLEHSQPAARRGLAAVGRLVRFDPWIAGKELSAADIVVFYSFTMSNRLTELVYQWNMLPEVPGLAQWYERFAARDIAQRVLADTAAVHAAMAAKKSA
jgi:glutathione S-transferase